MLWCAGEAESVLTPGIFGLFRSKFCEFAFVVCVIVSDEGDFLVDVVVKVVECMCGIDDEEDGAQGTALKNADVVSGEGPAALSNLRF